jgi:AcrR family transcriptional regulator
MASSRKDHLLKTALKLFNEHGFHATGIDKVQVESGVSKTTMYKYFKSKDELIRAVLEMRHEQFGKWFTARVINISRECYADHPYGKLMAMFDAVNEWIHSDTFFGCNFINASAEFSDLKHPIHVYASQHKLELSDYIRSCIPTLTEADSDELAKEILLLLDGAIVSAHTTGLKDSAERAQRMMLLILQNSTAEVLD